MILVKGHFNIPQRPSWGQKYAIQRNTAISLSVFWEETYYENKTMKQYKHCHHLGFRSEQQEAEILSKTGFQNLAHRNALPSHVSSGLWLFSSLLANWYPSSDCVWRQAFVLNVYYFAGKGPKRHVECCLFMKVKSVASKYRVVNLSILMNTLTLKSESWSVRLCITLKGSLNQCVWVDKKSAIRSWQWIHSETQGISKDGLFGPPFEMLSMCRSQCI